MQTKEKRGIDAARPVADILRLAPRGAVLVSLAISRSIHGADVQLAYAHKGSTYHLTFNREGGVA